MSNREAFSRVKGRELELARKYIKTPWTKIDKKINEYKPYTSTATVPSVLCYHQTWLIKQRSRANKNKNLIAYMVITVVNGLACLMVL